MKLFPLLLLNLETASNKESEIQNRCRSAQRAFCDFVLIYYLFCLSCFLFIFPFLFVTTKLKLLDPDSAGVSLLPQCSGDAELLQVLRPGDMAVYAVLAAAAQGPGLRPHHLFLLCHLLFLTCIQPLLQFPTNLLLLLPGLQLPSLHLQRARRDRHTSQVTLKGQVF